MDARISPGELDLAAVFAALPVATAVFAADPPRFTLLAVSDAFLVFAQRPRDAIVGRPLAEALASPRSEDARAGELGALRVSLAAAVQTGAPQRMARQQYELPRPDGSREARYWDALNVPVPGPDGAVCYVLHRATDVTAQVLDEAQAARAERRAERLIELMGDAHCVLDREFRIVSVNAAAERVLGVPRAALVGRSHWEAFPASEDAPVGRAFRRVIAEGVEQHLTHHYTGEGYDLHLEVDAYPTDEGGLAMFWRDVTERVRAEAALRASEEKYRALFNEMDEAYAVVEVLADAAGRWTDFRFLEVNPAFMRHTGMPYPVGCTATDLLGTPNPRWAELYGRAVDTGESIRVEESELMLGRVFDLNIFRLGGEGSRRVAVLFTDISARKRAENEVRRSEKRQSFLVRLEDALRPLAEPVAVQDAAARVLGEHLQVIRAMYAEVEGEPGAEIGIIRGRYVADLTLPAFPEQYTYGGFGSRVMPLRRRSETLVVADVTTDPRFEAAERLAWTTLGVRAAITVALVKDGRFVADFGVQSATARAWTADEVTLVEDTAERTWAASDRQRVEAALRANEERLRRALAIPTVGVLFFRLDGTIIDANGALERMLGYSVEELRRIRDWSVLTPPEFDEVTARAARELAAGGNTAPYEKQWRRKDGSRMWGLFAPTRLAGSGRASECVEFISDITRAKEAEAALLASEARLNLAAKAKDEFLANLGHELRTPLAAITLWATVIRRTGPGSNLERGLDAIVASAAAQAQLVDDLLDLSLVTTGHLRMAPTPVDPASVIRASAEIVRPAADSKGLKLEIDVAADLEPVLLDAQRLRQVLWNLLSNAIKFTPPGGTVRLGVRRHDGALEVDVIDSGEGIAPEFMPQLFERFRQADMSDTRRHGGLGIGLALSRHIVELQAGAIEAHSDGIGHGARFRVRLPWVSAAGEAAPVALAVGATEATRLSGVRVMLVEDDEHTLKAMKLALEQAGAEVHDVPTARLALSLLEAWQASGSQLVLVSDLHLPTMSGYELIERVATARRARGQPAIPACAISAGSGSDDRQRAIAAGYDIFLAKPVDAAQLVEAVADLRSVGTAETQS